MASLNLLKSSSKTRQKCLRQNNSTFAIVFLTCSASLCEKQIHTEKKWDTLAKSKVKNPAEKSTRNTV